MPCSDPQSAVERKVVPFVLTPQTIHRGEPSSSAYVAATVNIPYLPFKDAGIVIRPVLVTVLWALSVSTSSAEYVWNTPPLMFCAVWSDVFLAKHPTNVSGIN